MRRHQSVHQITDAPKPLSDDIGARQRKYMISMAIRTVAFIVAALAPIPIPFRILLIVASLVIPYVAVVMANGGREPTSEATTYYEPPGPSQLESPPRGIGGGDTAESSRPHGTHPDDGFVFVDHEPRSDSWSQPADKVSDRTNTADDTHNDPDLSDRAEPGGEQARSSHSVG